MRNPFLYALSAAALLAGLAPASAQTAQPPADAPATGLSDLSDTVDQLRDDQPPAESGPAETQAAETEAENEPASESGPEPTETDATGTESAPTEASENSEPAPNEQGPGEPASTAPVASQTPITATATPGAPPPPLSSEQNAELQLAGVRGRQLFAVARAGLLATQDMLSRVADPEGAGISGWVAEPEGNAMAVTFYGDSEGGPAAIYRARILGGRVVSRDTFLTGDRPPLSGTTLRMARARALTEAADQQACTAQPFNVVAIPPADAGAPILVYRISPPGSRNQLPLGGHFRATVDSAGNVSDVRAFSRGCLNVDVGEVAPGTQAGPIAVTHLLDPVPTEIHVFLSLFSGRPLVVAAGDPTRLFMVAGDQLREIRR